MDLFDSHCHLDDKAYHEDRPNVIKRARDVGVRRMMVVGITEKSATKAIALAQAHEGLYASVGVHPHDVKNLSQEKLERMIQMAATPVVKAWGEIGLDYNRMYSPKEIQEKWFIRQMEIANQLALPIIFHERDSGGRFRNLLAAHHSPEQGGVVHCFSGSKTEMTAYLDLNCHIGITGILTVKQRGQALRELVRHIPRQRLLIETDAPYLTPTPERNKYRRNEPAFVVSTFHKLAEILGESPDTLSHTLWENTHRLFKIPLPPS